MKWADSIITYSDPDSAADYQAGHPEAFTNFQQISAASSLAAHAALNDAVYTQPLGASASRSRASPTSSIDYAGSGTGAGTIRLANTSDPGHRLRLLPEQRV